ncbi:hypothetical protein ACIQMR_36915 [Streptomyces sp. NPDC091376]|uniref:hypothetical protein n=1 Tax=Streptomyces sp. NPDC091376 TaxID=3365994 RepID=UPI00380E65FD
MATHLRTQPYIVAAALLVGTALLTACQNGTTGTDASQQNGAPTPSPVGVTETSDKAAAYSKGVSGTFADGTVEHLAPGMQIVNVRGKKQQFWISNDTKIFGAGTICGPYNPKADTPCTIDDLEKILKSGSIAADVVIENGIAETITERPVPNEGPPVDDSADGSVDGRWLGNVKYLAPGKYAVSDSKGVEKAFFVSENTQIWGYGDICGDENTAEGGQGGTECTEPELESAARNTDLKAEVVIENGVATTIRDDH